MEEMHQEIGHCGPFEETPAFGCFQLSAVRNLKEETKQGHFEDVKPARIRFEPAPPARHEVWVVQEATRLPDGEKQEEGAASAHGDEDDSCESSNGHTPHPDTMDGTSRFTAPFPFLYPMLYMKSLSAHQIDLLPKYATVAGCIAGDLLDQHIFHKIRLSYTLSQRSPT